MTEIQISEGDLIDSVKNGESSGFNYLYTHYSPVLFAVILDKVVCYHTSKDILQEVFIRIHEKFELYDPARGRLFTWMLQITRHKVIDYFRSSSYKARHLSIEMRGEIPIPRSFDAIGIWGLVSKLDVKYQVVIRLAYFFGYSQVEISHKLAIPLGTVKTRLSVGLSILRSYCFEFIQ